MDNKITSIDILGFGYEMGLFPKISDEASEKGLSLRYKQIPNDIFNEDAVKNNAINFFDISYIGVDPKFKKDNLTIELTDFSELFIILMFIKQTLITRKVFLCMLKMGKFLKQEKTKRVT